MRANPTSASASGLITKGGDGGSLLGLNYYKRHIGDYATRTRTLSVAQHGIFGLLLDHYYTEEGPITTADANAICQARTARERAAVMEMLRRYFDEEPDGRWRNERCDAEITDYLKVVQKNRCNGARHVPRETSPLANPDGKPLAYPLASQTISQTEPSHYPLPITHKEEEKALVAGQAADPPKASDCPHDEIIATYHELLPVNPRVRQWDERRKTYLRSRWREAADRQSLDWWRKFFGYVAGSDFLTGKVNGTRAAFLPSLEWMVKPANFIKIIEGNYENR